VLAAGDAHDLRAGRAGGARAAAGTAGDAALPAVRAQWTVLVPAVLPYQPRQFFLRELPPLRAVLAPVRNPGRPVTGGYADRDPGGRPRPGRASARGASASRSPAWPLRLGLGRHRLPAALGAHPPPTRRPA